MIVFDGERGMMKKTVFLCLGLSVLLTACGSKDEAYYKDHVEEAQTKVAECEKEVEKLFMAQDKEGLEILMAEGSECRIVEKVVREEEIRQKELAREQAKKEAYTKVNTKYGALSWREFTVAYLKFDCASRWAITDEDFECKAMQEMYESNVQKGIAEMKQYSLDELLAKEGEFCKKDRRKYSACDVWKKAVAKTVSEHFKSLSLSQLYAKKQVLCKVWSNPSCEPLKQLIDTKNKEVIQGYVDDYELLKQDYNRCVVRYQNATTYEAQREVANTYPCPQTSEAKRKLGLSQGFFEQFDQKLE